MRNIHFVFLTVLLACPTIFLPLTSESQAQSPDPRIYLDPSDNVFYSNVTGVGHRFNVTVSLSGYSPPPNLGGANIHLEFDDSIINVTQWWAPYWDPNFFMPSPYKTLPDPPNPGYIHVIAGLGYVEIAVSKGGYPPVAPWGHNGTICIFEFKITAVPTDGGQLSCSLHINHAYTYLLDTSAEEIPGVTKEDGTYTIVPEFSLVILLSVFIVSTAAVVLLRKKVIRKLN